MTNTNFPPGWNEERVLRVLKHYGKQSELEAIAEDEAIYDAPTHTIMEVPVDLVPAFRALIAKRNSQDPT